MSAGDRDLLRGAVREMLRGVSPPAEVRRRMDTVLGWDGGTWRRLCGELGVAGLAVPEEYGGQGYTHAELGVVFEEAGRALLCAPLLSTAALAIPLLLALDDEDARRRHLPDLCAGARTAAVVTSDPDGRPLPSGNLVEAAGGGNGHLLHGTAGFVVDGASADLVLVPARTDGDDGGGDGDGGGVAVFAVEAGAPGFTATPLVTLDPTRKQAELRFEGTPARRIGPPDASAAYARALDVGRALLAAEQAGGAAACLDAVVGHAGTRVQFGRPIGSFQAVKQRAAEMLIRVESARSAAQAAAQAAAEAVAGHGTDAGDLRDLPDLDVTAAVAQAYCSDAFVRVAAETIQLHGGIGFTWEHDAHLYYKRAWTSGELLGRPEEHLENLARHLERR
ncbi:acyl-CoA dehydrogenase [Actinomadura cremea]|nr:acyl-CoA dehydrogenase [Actinomadura cremea]